MGGHSSTLSVFIPQSSKRRLPLHASYCCMRFTCFPFSTAKVKKSRVQESDVFHYVVQATTLKSQEFIDIRSRHVLHYVVQPTTCKSQEFIDIRTRHLSKHTKINLYYKYCFHALILLTLTISLLLHGL